jgi:hypothetical protein
LPPVRLRLEVGDDGRGPPVGDCGRAAAGMGRSWARIAGGPSAAREFEGHRRTLQAGLLRRTGPEREEA